MANLTLTKNDIPLWLGGSGNLKLTANVPNINQALAPTDQDILAVEFGVAGGDSFVFGASNNLKLGVRAGAMAKLTPLWPSSSEARRAMLDDHGLGDYFASHPDDVLLALTVGATADANLAGSFRYSILTANATLDAGGDAAYSYLRGFRSNTAAEQLLRNFFAGLRLPCNVTTALEPGEVIAFEYGGYLKLGAGLSIGYELAGAPSFDIGQLSLSERYRLSIIGKLAVGASIAGNFAVEVRAAEDAAGTPMPGWTRVIVRKRRATQFRVAADVSVDASSQLEGLPDSGNEFLGALLGVNVKNWLNLIERVRELSDLETLKTELDDLAENFLTEYIGKAFDELSQTEFATFLTRVEKIIDSYEDLDNEAITLFDRYFDKLDVLTAKLNELAALTSWDKLKGEVDAELWNIVRRLTGGDPLTWILGHITIRDTNGQPISIPSLPELQKRVQHTLVLIKGDAHEEIRKLIAVAKSKFPLDGFIKQLSTVDSIPKLKAIAEDKAGAFVERLIGKGIDSLSNSEIGHAVTRIHQALEATKTFEDKLYAKFKDAVDQSFSFRLHAEYSRASERDALIDVMINLNTDQGKALMQSAGRGEFQEVLASYRPELVKINQGILTHNVTRQSAFSVNVIGWHSGWHYQGMDRVIVNAEQQIKAEANGALSVFTTVDMTKEKERIRNGERMYTNFLLRFIGESRGAIAFDKRNQQYLIDTITGMAASYRLSFDDPQTSRTDLDYYLSFAGDFGLTPQGATMNQLLPMLTSRGPDDFGRVSTDYEVRYTEAGLRRAFSAPFDEAAIRTIMRKIVLANYIRDDALRALGWCYWTQRVFDEWKQGQAQFTNRSSAQFAIQASPFSDRPAPAAVPLQRSQLFVLSTLFFIEERLIAGLAKLDKLVHAGIQISAHEFENALGDIGTALKEFDRFDEGVNTLFAVFDQLVRLAVPADEVRLSSLRMTSQAGGQEVTKMFIAQPVPASVAPISTAARV
jgi:hypothetical protein